MTRPVEDHAVLVPTSLGPVGAIVSEPADTPRGALVLLPGGGPPARAGIDAAWTRIARDVAALGLVVLRPDLVREGDSSVVGRDVHRRFGWRRDTDLALMREVAPWFRERVGERELLVAGSCYGARVALDWAAGDRDVSGAFVVVPYLWNRPPPNARVPDRTRRDRLRAALGRWSATARRRSPDPWELDSPPPDLVDGLRGMLARGSRLWMLIGERDRQDAFVAREQLGAAGEQLEIEVVPGMALHPVGSPETRTEVGRRLADRLASVAGDRAPVP